MMLAVLIAGIGLLLAGLVTVGLGIQLDLSFGNTLILAGAIVTCTGFMMLALWTVVRELKKIAGQLGLPQPLGARAAAALPPPNLAAALGNQAPNDGGLLFSGDQPSADHVGRSEPAPWQDETASRDRGEAPPEPAEAAKQRRNLLFSSSSRKERERVQARAPDAPAVAAQPAAELAEVAPPATFEDAWPKSERAKTAAVPPPRQGGRAPSTFTEPGVVAPEADRHPPAPRSEAQTQVTVLKSGVVDGMAYSLYSDGSIEAQMPEGMMRFASIDELRAHLDHRP